MGCSLPGSSDHGIFQARILEWVAISFFRGSSWPRDRTCISCIAGRFFTTKSLGKPLLQRGKYKTMKIFCLLIPSLSLSFFFSSALWFFQWSCMDVRVSVKKAECQRIDAFELWCWRRLLRVPWTARRSNQSILKESVLGVLWKDWC